MPRKKEPTSVTEGNIFPIRLRELMEERAVTQKKLADAIGMRPQTVSLYTTGQRAPDVNTLRKMADFFNVSADYLLGRTDVKKPEVTIRAICEYTGLSAEAVAKLKDINDYFNYLQHHGCRLPLDRRVIFNFFVINDNFWNGIQCVSELQAITQGITPAEKDARIETTSGYIPITENRYCEFLQHNAVSSLAAAMYEYIATFRHDTVRIAETVDVDYGIYQEGGPSNAIHQGPND
jgi:Predicted transcriptional regulators